MKRNTSWVVAMAAAMLIGSVVAQTSASGAANSTANQNPQAAASEPSPALSGRTPLLVDLTKGLDAKICKVNDPVEGKRNQDVKSGTKVLLHRGAKLTGHVTEAQARSRENPESRLGFVFDKAVGKGGEEFTFRAVVMAIAPSMQESTTIAGDPTRLSSGPAMGGQPYGAGNAVGGPSASAAPAVEAATHGGVGSLTAESRGVIGLPGVALRPSVVDGVQGTVIISPDHNVKLDSGIQMLLLVSGPPAAH